MIRKLIRSWKEEWLNRNEAKLAKEFDSAMAELKANTQSILADHQAKVDALNTDLKAKESVLRISKIEIDVLSKQIEERKARLEKEELELRHQIKLVEAKTSPDNLWLTAFSMGFNKAWEMQIPIMTDGVIKMKQFIHDQAIEETIKNNPTWTRNGNNKKTY